jgi:glycosyltransferase involved in cell wall biosynthesis
MYHNIFYLVTFTQKSGGGLYGRYVSTLKNVQTYHLLNNKIKNRFLKFVTYLFNLYKFQKSKKSKDIIIRTLDSCFFMNKEDKNILLVHHYHPVSDNILIRSYQKFLYWNMLRNIDKIDTLVVVSEYWKVYFLKMGFNNIKVIYNPFDIDMYAQKTYEEKERFKKKYQLEEKPIIYLGNPQKEKGTDKSYEVLKNLDVHFVSTGIQKIELPVKHLDLSFDEYITLLQVSTLSVLMSQIKEGWNRVAHESILSHTPVVGTGRGGMGELLNKADQTICQDWNELPIIVEKMIKEKVDISQEELKYVDSFNVDGFMKSWSEVFGVDNDQV